MNLNEILKISGALHHGHTEFRNGNHSDGWIQKDLIVRNPVYLDNIAELQANEIMDNFPGLDMVLGPVTGGAIIVSHVAKYLRKEFGVILGKQDPVIFHDMNIPKKGDKVVIVEDIISSGTDMNRYISFLKSLEIEVLGISVWLNRNGKNIRGIKVASLLENNFNIYLKDNCPLCLKGEDIVYKNIRE